MSKTNIRKIIERKGLTVPQAAEVCRLPLSTVSAHYYGQRPTMNIKSVLKYVQGLGVSVEEIMEGRA
jgi:hypothetical protein